MQATLLGNVLAVPSLKLLLGRFHFSYSIGLHLPIGLQMNTAPVKRSTKSSDLPPYCNDRPKVRRQSRSLSLE
jgi:hypothetical protein